MKRIIVTDDEPMNLRMAEFLLRKNGYDVVLADSGKDCLEKLAGGADLVLLDILMPGMDGFQTCQMIRDSYPDIPVIFLTAAEGSDIIEKGLEMGCDCISKPFLPEVLLSAVKKRIG